MEMHYIRSHTTTVLFIEYPNRKFQWIPSTSSITQHNTVTAQSILILILSWWDSNTNSVNEVHKLKTRHIINEVHKLKTRPIIRKLSRFGVTKKTVQSVQIFFIFLLAFVLGFMHDGQYHSSGGGDLSLGFKQSIW
jgi:hypothetical protein